MIRRMIAAAALLGGLGTTAARAEGELNIYNWTDYTSPELIQKFEKETGIKVTVDTYDSNETLLAKLKSGSGGYDVIVVSSDFVPIFAEQSLIKKIDAAGLPGYQNLDPRWRSPDWDKGNQYTVPWNWGLTSFGVNTKEIKEPADSLKLLFEPPAEAKGKVGMFGSPSEVIGLAEVYLGLTPCQTDTAAMKKVQDLLVAQSPFVKVYNSDGIIERQVSGETWIHEQWSGSAMRSRLQNPDIKFVFPKEGAVGWMDNVAVPAAAAHPDSAKRFIEFILQPENMALQSNFTKYANAIVGSEKFFTPDMAGAPEMSVPDGLKVVFSPSCPEAAIKLMDRVWTRLKK